MKKLKLFSLLAATALLSSCGGNEKSESADETTEFIVKPASTAVGGALKGTITVVDGEYRPENDKLAIELERSNEALPFNPGLKLTDNTASETEIVGALGIELLDVNGSVVGKVEPDYTTAAAIKNLLESNSGTKAKIEFDLPASCTAENCNTFRITSDVQMPVKYFMQGKINDKYTVYMTFNTKGHAGAYFYQKVGSKNNYLTLNVNSYNPKTGKLVITEYNPSGEATGRFDGVLDKTGYHGNGTFLGKEMPFALDICSEDTAEWPDLSQVTIFESAGDYTPDASESGSSSDNAIDRFLDKYESAIDQLISLSKRVQNGDVTAMDDIASYTSDITDAYDELSNAQSQMTSAQHARFNSLIQKAAKAAL